MAVLQLLPTMASSNDAPASSSSASVHSDEDSHHPSVVSHLFDGELSADELNEIPDLPHGACDTYDFDPEVANALLDESHPATQIALTASVLDGALGNFEFLPITQLAQQVTTTSTNTSVPQEVPILPAASTAQETMDKETSKGKKRSPSKKAGGPTKKRRTSKAKKEEDPALISPGSNQSLAADRKMTVTPPLSSSSMPVLHPVVSGSTTKPLLPRPDATPAPPAAPTSAPAADSPTSAPEESKEPLVVPGGPANISTEHIQMLTGENGPAECAKAIVTTTTGVDGRRVSKSHLSQEERAQASRDRNREHARNTRLRKKAYVEELKRTLLALCDQRDANALKQQRKTKLEGQHRNVRFSVLEEFLRLRGSNSNAMDRWSAILVPEFSLRLPAINANDQVVADQTLAGVHQVMEESNAFFAFLQTIGNGNSMVTLQYSMDRSNLFMDGNNAVLEFQACTAGAVAKGAKGELNFHGNIKATFDPDSNKIVSASMLFDSSVVIAQKKSLASN